MSGFEAAVPYLIGAAGATAVTTLMKDDGPAAAMATPTLKPPVPMPDPKATGDAKKRSIAEQLRRQGRASTILSDNSGDALGG